MSMILDALQRADRERRKQEQTPPSLSTPTTPPPRQAPTPRWAWWLAGAGLALALVAVLLFVALPRPPAPAPTGHPSARAVQPQEQAPTPEPAPKPASEPRAKAAPAKPQDIAELYHSPQVDETSVSQLYRTAQSGGRPTPTVDASKASAIEGAEGHTQQLAERPKPAAVRLSQAESAPQTARETQPAQAAPSKTAAPKPEPAPEPTPAVPSVRDLPWNLQQTMPSLNYQRHDYREGAASRVVINGKELRAGQQVASDLKLERIEEDGAILRYQGHQFKLRALNSWVNM
ncbi:general secretion pathway protein GspB [Marinimicrobium locisalis]|uniref:general secretion pathway protein GspB n=1 Tax=Marinimicrobium locisalis TaxID=546022 RepID=UPI0032218253